MLIDHGFIRFSVQMSDDSPVSQLNDDFLNDFLNEHADTLAPGLLDLLNVGYVPRIGTRNVVMCFTERKGFPDHEWYRN